MRWIFRLVGLVAVLAVAAVAALYLLPADRIARLASDRFEAATGRAMTLEGDVRPSLWPEIGIETGRVTIANAPWSDAGPMLTAERLAIGVDPLALIRGEVRIRSVEAVRPEILLEVAADGRANWQMAAAGTGGGAGATGGGAGAPGGGGDGARGMRAFSLDEAVIAAGGVRFVDHGSGARTTLAGIDARLALPDFAGPADLTLAAEANGQPVSAVARVGDFAAFLGDGVVPVSLEAETGGTTVTFEGRAGLRPVTLGGRLDADLSDLGAVFAALGRPAPVLPGGLGDPLSVAGEITLTESGARLTLREGRLRAGPNTLTGDADLTVAERPRLTASLAAGALDLSALAGGGPASGSGTGSGDGGSGGGGGWSRAPIDVSALQALDAEIALAAESVDLGLARFGRARLYTTLDAGRAVTEIRELEAYGGTAAGSVVVNSRGGLSARTDLQLSQVALKPLLSDFAGYERLEARGDVTLQLLAVGNDMATLMNSLDGQGSVALGRGELTGLDLVGMLRNLDTSFVGAGAKTIFDSITASVTVADGTALNDDLAFRAPLLNASGAGEVGIGAQTLDYTLTATLLETGDGAVRVPIRISGPWASPRFGLDLEALAEERIADEVEKLKDTAEDAVRERVSEELGVTLDADTPLEDAVKEEIEKRARDGLLDLLGGGN